MQPISNSELILNPDGSIYHLNLCPEDIAPIILTVGDPGRVARISRHFDELLVKKEKREFCCHTGRIGRKRITAISTGIGPDNIDIALNELDALVNIDFASRQPKAAHTALTFVRVGTSGALRPDIPVDSFVASAFGVGLDNLMRFYDYTPTMPEAELTDELSRFMDFTKQLPFYACQGSHSLLDALGEGMQHGITLTSPGFYGPQGRKLRLTPRFDQRAFSQLAAFTFKSYPITNFEMETSAIYGLSRLLGHRALSTNAIIANRADGTFSQHPKDTIDRLIVKVLEGVSELD
jgi:uridine phosphorylase